MVIKILLFLIGIVLAIVSALLIPPSPYMGTIYYVPTLADTGLAFGIVITGLSAVAILDEKYGKECKAVD